jgi:hypothetical protein
VNIRYQADANLKQMILLAAKRQEPAMDFSSALQAELAGLPDSEVLAVATKEARILVTHDLRTMHRHFADFLQTATSPGVLLVPQHLPVPEVVDELIFIWAYYHTTLTGSKGRRGRVAMRSYSAKW